MPASNLTLIYDASVLIDATRMSGSLATPLAATGSAQPQLFFGPRNSISVSKDVEYTLAFSAACRKTAAFFARMDVYVVGTAMPTVDPYGIQLTSYTTDYGAFTQLFENQIINFTALSDGDIRLRFVVYGGDWNVSNVSFKPASEFGFTPDSINILAPVVGHKFEALEFRAELYDLNNNLVPVTIETPPTVFDGGNSVIKGQGNRVDGELIVAPSGSSGAVITTKGFFDVTGSFQTGSPAIFIGTGQHANANTPFLAASSSAGPVFSLGDRLIAGPSGSSYAVTVSGTLLVQNEYTNTFEDVRQLIYTASINPSSSLYSIETSTNALLSSSLALAFSSSLLSASIASNSASSAAYIVSTSVVDSLNKIKLPTSTKIQDGLYLESSSMGFYNVAQSQYPVVINAGGQFRFADSASYVGGSDPYTNVVGFANGAFMVRTSTLLLQTPSFQLIGASTASAAANQIKLGTNAANITLVSGSGFYADGAGNLRVGATTGSGDYVLFNSNNALIISSSNFFLDAGTTPKLQLNAFRFIVGSKIPGTWPFPLNDPDFSGSYINTAGQIFFGNASGNYIQFGGSTLDIRTSNILVSGSAISIDSSVSGGLIRLGNATAFNVGTGIYMDGTGKFHAGNPTTNVINFDGTNLNMSIAENSTGSGSVAPIQDQMANYIAFGPFGFYISNL